MELRTTESSSLLFFEDEATDRVRPELEQLAVKLAAVLPSLPATAPVLVSGDWGAGKTSLLQAIRSRLASDIKPAAVWFDAWHHEGQVALLPALVRRIWESTPDSYRGTANAISLFGKVWRCAALATLRAAPLLAQFTPVPFLGEFIKALKPKDLLSDVEKIEDNLAPPEDEVIKLRKYFVEMIQGAWPRVRPIIFIDDLDRCSPEGSVALLDAIRMIVTGRDDLSCQFIVALDRRVMSQAISNKFAGIKGYDGNRYLEKIFPFEFRVPPPNGNTGLELLRALLGTSREQHLGALSIAFRNPFFANPRLMKRTLNRFLLTLHLEERDDVASIDNKRLAMWIVATERWPRLRAIHSGRTAHYWEAVAELYRQRGDQGVDADLAQLLQEPGCLEWFRERDFPSKYDWLNEFDTEDERLRKWGL